MPAPTVMQKADFSAMQAHELRDLTIRLYNGNSVLIAALADMVNQFFVEAPDGVLTHSFMSAEEEAMRVLIQAGFAEEIAPGSLRINHEAIEQRQQIKLDQLTWEQAVNLFVKNEAERKALLDLDR